ncbi:hypothetical protein WI460_15000 [Gemmatimonadota bacterium Y43]|uniref:hypothetical protein n=1 Tax=Gaopeijia maritima TaxID=3119007 RepID=UPI00326D00F0
MKGTRWACLAVARPPVDLAPGESQRWEQGLTALIAPHRQGEDYSPMSPGRYTLTATAQCDCLPTQRFAFEVR